MRFMRLFSKGTAMDTVFQLLTLLIPALLVFLTAWFFLNKMRHDQREMQRMLLRLEERKHSLPLQLKAYERLIIMLERITPGPLVMRVNKGSMNSAQLQLELLKAVREEFEHNISMQMYVSRSAWELTRTAKDEVMQLIKIAATKTEGDATAMRLSQVIFELEQKTQNESIKNALNVLKSEAQQKM